MTVDPATLDLLPDPTVLVGADGIVAVANDLAVRLAGDIEGRPAADALPLSDEAGADWWACTRPLEGDARLLARVPEVDLWLQTADRPRPVTLTAARIPDAGGTALLLSLRRAERRARLDAARSELVASVSHDLRSPLTSVRGFTRTLLARWERFTDEQRRQMLRTIDADAERIARLLNELLDVSRIDAGRLQLRRRMVDLGALVESLDVDDVTARVPAGLPQLYADPDRVSQAIGNLVEDAVHRGAGRVTVAVEQRDASLACIIAGASGAPSFTKPVRDHRGAGTGLGPYVAKGIVEAHGGRIWAHDDAVTFELPLGDPEPVIPGGPQR
jgi:signal transduction histidine kinase